MSTITSILSNDLISSGPSVLNANFHEINNSKVEGSVLSGSYYTASFISGSYVSKPIPASVLGSGTASANTFLRGDMAWAGAGNNVAFVTAGASPEGFGGRASLLGGASFTPIPVWKYPDGVTSAVNFSVQVPNGYTGISSIWAVIVGDNIGGNANLQFTTGKFSTNASTVAYAQDTTDTYTTYAIQASTSILQIQCPSGAFNGISPVGGDVVVVQVARDANSGSDTHNTVLDLAGILVRWH